MKRGLTLDMNRKKKMGKAALKKVFKKIAAGDIEARNALALEYMGMVRYLASRFVNRGETFEELVQVASLALMNAIDRFDPDKGVEFETFATPTIIGELKRYFRDKSHALRLPRKMQELYGDIGRAAEELTSSLHRSPRISEIAEYLDVSEEQVLEAQEMGQNMNTISIYSEVMNEEERKNQNLLDLLGEQDPRLEKIEDIVFMERAFASLSRREKLILFLRFYEGLPQNEIAGRIGVSQMHVSRLQGLALEKMKEYMLRCLEDKDRDNMEKVPMF
ncbi:MAG: SigB/SigF/SigG family RNA polymerase sigma factor [Chloroflexi bacterium]|nr:SigB/SigF/SigG family RNA polymerase sigma factor [Chloroflexota bacterium]